MIPTYNEAENIKRLIPVILKKAPNVSILVVDDNSPDKTADEVKKLAKRYPKRVHLLLRREKKGRGSAGIDGFKWLLKRGADAVIEMDADFSHHPKYLPKMINNLKDADVVVGSRFIKAGKDMRGPFRSLITILGRIYIRLVLGVNLKDPTSGYRAFKKRVLQAVDLDNLIAVKTWAVVQEVLYKAALMNFKIKEVPIIFVDRKRGNSKLNLKVLLQGMLLVLVLRFEYMAIWRHDPLKNE